MGHLYDENSIESLDPLSFTRLKPGVYAGDTTYSTQLMVEIISNAIDEYRLGHGNRIDISFTDTVMAVRDHGQGFIYSFRDDGKSILEAAFSVLNTSGKFREDGTYEGTSLGSFGIGGKLANFLSHKMKVISFRDGIQEQVVFIEGKFDSREVSKCDKKITGTYVEWEPSEEFFTHTNIEVNKIISLVKTLVCLCPNLTIDVYNNEILSSYKSINGLHDLVDEAVKETELIKNRFELNFEQSKYKVNMVMTYTNNYSFTIVPYVNTGLTESGSHITQLKTTLTREFNKFFREKKWLKEKEDNLSGEDIQEGMYIVFNLTVPDVGYDAQVKSRIVKIDTKPFVQAVAAQLNTWFNENEKEIKLIADKAINARKAREAAKKAKENVRTTQNKKEKRALKFNSKLADCYSKDRSKCELIVTEGDSASGNLKAARNNEFQAVIPIRGKLLNVQKTTPDKIKKNAEIMTIAEAIGLTIDAKTMQMSYNSKDLRYDKIIILADSDIDGAHVRNLFYTFIWTLCPQLILDGHIYAGIAPLYKVTTSKGYKYLQNDASLRQYEQEHLGRKYSITRFKGLGELSAEETEETLLNPKNRVLKQITVKDIEQTDNLFNDLMGNAIAPRKKFIITHSQEAVFNE